MIRDDLKISDKLMAVYRTINYYDRYKQLSEKYNTEEECLEKTDKKNVLELFKKLGYTAKYKARERFYQVLEETNGVQFYFHVGLQYGLTEFIFGVLREEDENGNKKGELIGGKISRVCSLIKLTETDDINVYKSTRISPPRFRTYEELKSILEESLSLYEDLKQEILKSYFN